MTIAQVVYQFWAVQMFAEEGNSQEFLVLGSHQSFSAQVSN